MGACCSTENKKKPVTTIQTLDDQKLKNFHITGQEIDKSIEGWVQKTKRRKPDETVPVKLEEEKNVGSERVLEKGKDMGIIHEDEIKAEIINTDINHLKQELKNFDQKNDPLDKVSVINNSEIRDDFEMKHKFHQQYIVSNNNNFSVSSTIHFTGMDGKEVIHKLGKINPNWIHSIKSQSIVNVLDELNFNNDKRNTIKNDKGKELSIVINERSKLTVKKKNINTSLNKGDGNNPLNSKNEIFSILSNNYQKNAAAHVESYAIVSKSKNDRRGLSIDDNLKQGRNDATVHDATVKSNFEFFQENVFYHVEKFDVSFLNNYSSIKCSTYLQLMDKMSLINSISLPIWRKDTYEKLSYYNKKPSNVTKELEGVDWKKMNKISNNPKIFGNDLKNFKYIKLGHASESSIVSAIILLCNYEFKFDKKLITSIIYPMKEDRAIISKTGLYALKIYINGTFRNLEIDDCFPYDKSSQKALLSSTSDSEEFFPQLIEKGLLSLYEYKKISTNPSYEIYHLCGWYSVFEKGYRNAFFLKIYRIKTIFGTDFILTSTKEI